MKILITGGRSYVALEFIRLLKSHEIYVVDSQDKYLCQKTKYIVKSFISNKPVSHYKEFKRDILKIIQENNIEILIPTSEEIFFLSIFKDEIEKAGCHFMGESFEVLRGLHSKYELMQKCLGMGINIPKTIKFSTRYELEQFLKKGDIREYVIKPEFSRFASQIVSNKFGKKKLQDMDVDLKHNSYILQEYVTGLDICSYSLFNNGCLVSHVSYISVNRHNNGASISFETYDDEQGCILDFVNRFGSEKKIHGQIAFDFKVNNNNITLLECNPRATNGIHLLHNDRGFKEVLHNLLHNKKNISLYIHTNKTNKIHFIPLLFCMIFYFRFSLFKYVHRVDLDVIYDKKDKKVFWYQLYLFLFYITISFSSGKSITEAMTYDIEYDGQNLYT